MSSNSSPKIPSPLGLSKAENGFSAAHPNAANKFSPLHSSNNSPKSPIKSKPADISPPPGPSAPTPHTSPSSTHSTSTSTSSSPPTSATSTTSTITLGPGLPSPTTTLVPKLNPNAHPHTSITITLTTLDLTLRLRAAAAIFNEPQASSFYAAAVPWPQRRRDNEDRLRRARVAFVRHFPDPGAPLADITPVRAQPGPRTLPEFARVFETGTFAGWKVDGVLLVLLYFNYTWRVLLLASVGIAAYTGFTWATDVLPSLRFVVLVVWASMFRVLPKWIGLVVFSLMVGIRIGAVVSIKGLKVFEDNLWKFYKKDMQDKRQQEMEEEERLAIEKDERREAERLAGMTDEERRAERAEKLRRLDERIMRDYPRKQEEAARRAASGVVIKGRDG